MIERVVLVKLKPEYSADAETVAQTSVTVLGAAPGVLAIRGGAPADARTRARFDVLLELRFKDLDAIERYRAHEVHRKYLEVFLRPMLAQIEVLNFELRGLSERVANS